METKTTGWTEYAKKVSHNQLASLAAQIYFDTNARSLANEDLADWLKKLDTEMLVKFMNDHSKF